MEPFVHLLIPLAFLLLVFPYLRKKALILFPLTFLMDLDIFTSYHRYLFHNLFFVLVISLLLLYSLDWEYFFISLFYLFSHIVLDVGTGVALVWPFSSKLFYLSFNLFMFKENYIMTQGFLFLILIFVLFTFWIFRGLHKPKHTLLDNL
mgnify:CR=1 FL=1